MLKRLFGRGKQNPEPEESASRVARPAWQAPTAPWVDCFALHLHHVEAPYAEQAIRQRYLLHLPSGAQGALLLRQGAWQSAFFPREVVAGIGFNQQASQIAAESGQWVIGYRLFAGQGLDAHLFHAGDHVTQLAFAGTEIEWEPEEAAALAPLAAVEDLVPRVPGQHPLDFWVALLARFGIERALLPWEEALAAHERGEGGTLLVAP